MRSSTLLAEVLWRRFKSNVRCHVVVEFTLFRNIEIFLFFNKYETLSLDNSANVIGNNDYFGRHNNLTIMRMSGREAVNGFL